MNVDEDFLPSKEVLYFINANKEEGIRSHAFKSFDDISEKKMRYIRPMKINA